MKITKPVYFDSFRCIAGACPDSCCKEWDVQVDDDAAAFYRALPGPLGDRLRQVLKDEDGETVMTIIDRRCPMWRDDGLCEIQAQLGHDALQQLKQLQLAVSGGKQVLQDAAAALYAIRPLTEEE